MWLFNNKLVFESMRGLLNKRGYTLIETFIILFIVIVILFLYYPEFEKNKHKKNINFIKTTLQSVKRKLEYYYYKNEDSSYPNSKNLKKLFNDLKIEDDKSMKFLDLIINKDSDYITGGETYTIKVKPKRGKIKKIWTNNSSVKVYTN